MIDRLIDPLCRPRLYHLTTPDFSGWAACPENPISVFWAVFPFNNEPNSHYRCQVKIALLQAEIKGLKKNLRRARKSPYERKEEAVRKLNRTVSK